MNRFFTISFVILLSACATKYYGYSEEEWQIMSEQERALAKKEFQQTIDRRRNEQRHRDVIRSRDEDIIERGVEGL